MLAEILVTKINITFIDPLDCPVNTFAPQGSSQCTVCPAGYASPANSIEMNSCKLIACTNGTINAPKCDTCPAGQEFKNNSCSNIVAVVNPTAPVIPVTTTTPSTPLVEIKKDIRVVEPKVEEKVAVAKENCVSNPGYYTNENGDCQICPINYYCPGGNTGAIQCPISTFVNYQGAKSKDECKPQIVQISTNQVRTVRTGGLELFAVMASTLALFGYGYYFIFGKNQKGQFESGWNKIK
jgi:hypothetical protein